MAQSLSDAVQEALSLFGSDVEEETELLCDTKDSLDVQIDSQTRGDLASKASAKVEATNTVLDNSPWHTKRPRYISKMCLTKTVDIGGGRGFVAAEDLSPGTLLILEDVYVPWFSDVDHFDEISLMSELEHMLKRSDFRDIITHLRALHPQKLSDMPSALLAAGRQKYGNTLQNYSVTYAKHGITADELLQTVFSIQCNAFSSGIFLYCSLFNHDCSPNCVKFSPNGSSTTSEVRTCKTVAKGEPLTISYLFPREQLRSTRRSLLWNQFGFLCNCSLCQRGDSLLRPPPHTGPTSTSALTIDDVESRLCIVEAELHSNNSRNARHLLDDGLELLSDALETVAYDHLILIRIYKLITDSCELCSKDRQHAESWQNAVTFVRCAYELLSLQRQYLSDDHIDLARTLNDLSQGIQELLAHDVEGLLEEFPEWENFRNASMMENKYRQEHIRVKNLYNT